MDACERLVIRYAHLGSGRNPRNREILERNRQVAQHHIAEIQAEIRRYHPRLAFDLGEATLVDREVVCFLASQEMEGVELVECPRYIREWIARERIQDCSFNPTKENES